MCLICAKTVNYRKNGELSLDKDEFVAVGSVHQDDYGEIAHTASNYLFWHGYLLWFVLSLQYAVSVCITYT